MSFHFDEDSPGARRELAMSRKRLLSLIGWGVAAIFVVLIASAIAGISVAYP